VRLLLVEDSALIRKVTRLAFPSREHELHEAENGLEAIGLVDGAAQPFDAILLDLQMPDMDGVAFIRALRQRPLHRDTPIVVVTSEAESSVLLQEARRLGVAAVAKKPWKPQELAALRAQACVDRSPRGKPPA
jgi:two-component system, chemotaxis family, chemotaxis protein CheY